MKRIMNIHPSAANPIVIEGEPWGFELQKEDFIDGFKLFTLTEGEPLDFFVTAEDFNPSLKGVIKNEYGEKEEQKITRDSKRDDYEGQLCSKFQNGAGSSGGVVNYYESLKFKIKLKKESAIKVEEEGIYCFNFLDNNRLTLKYLTGTVDDIVPIGPGTRNDWGLTDFRLFGKEGLVNEKNKNDIEFNNLITTITLKYSFKIFSDEEKTQRIFPVYKEKGFYFEKDKIYYFILESEEVENEYKCNVKNCLTLKGKESKYEVFKPKEEGKEKVYSKSPFYLITGKNFFEETGESNSNDFPKKPSENAKAAELNDILDEKLLPQLITCFSNLDERLDRNIPTDLDFENYEFNEGEEEKGMLSLDSSSYSKTHFEFFSFIFSMAKIDLGVQKITNLIKVDNIETQLNRNNNCIKISYTPKEIALSNNNSKTNYFIVIENNEDSPINSLIEPYNLIKKPTITVTEGESLGENAITFSCKYDDTNKYPKLWHRIQINNIGNTIYDSKEVYTSVPDFSFKYDNVLPNELYQIIISVSDTNNIESEKYIYSYETKQNNLEIDFKKKEIVSKTSESFLKINCKEFGFGEKLLPSINLFPGKNLYPLSLKEKDFIETKILRQNLINNHAIWVATVSKEEANNKKEINVYDYGAKANIPYTYWAYGDFNSISKDDDEVSLYIKGLQGIKLNDEPIIVEWDRWTLITADKDPENEKIYHVDKVFTFEMNLSSGSMTNGTNITTSKNFTEFPVIQKDKSNFYSGSLTALMGVRKWGSTAEDFEQTPHMLEELKSLSTNYQPKFLKDRSGHLWQVEINGAIQVANTDNLATIDLKTMTVPWVQIGEADNISLIYTGTEKKEDLYC